MAPAAVRTRPAWPAWTSVHALALHPDGRRLQRCLHRDHGYPLRDGYLVQLHPDPHRSLGGCPEPRRHRLGAVRSRPDGRHLERDGLRRLDHQDHLDGRPERLAWRLGRLLLGHPDVAHAVRQDVVPGTDCCHPDAGAGHPREAGTGYCRQDAGAGGAYPTEPLLEPQSRRHSPLRRRRRPAVPAERALSPVQAEWKRRRA